MPVALICLYFDLPHLLQNGPTERDRLRIAVLDESSIVCSTLSFAGSPMFYRMARKFDVVIIDEAAQAVEPSLLVPLVMGCKQVRRGPCHRIAAACFASHRVSLSLFPSDPFCH